MGTATSLSPVESRNLPDEMAPKAATKKSAAAPQHGSYQDMIKVAIMTLKERNGSSRQAIKKDIKANNNLGNTTDNAFTAHINKALKTGVDSGVFAQPKGASGPVKLAKPSADKKPAAATKTAKPKTEKKETAAAPKKTTAAKKTAAPKKTTTKAAPKKTATAKKPAAKKAAAPKTASKKTTKPKAAPAVSEEKPKALTKTKTGRVVKTSKPETAKAIAGGKKAPARKATPNMFFHAAAAFGGKHVMISSFGWGWWVGNG